MARYTELTELVKPRAQFGQFLERYPQVKEQNRCIRWLSRFQAYLAAQLIVQALKSLGREHVTQEVISKIREWLAPNLRARVLADTETATGWVYAALRQIAGKDTNGASRESAN